MTIKIENSLGYNLMKLGVSLSNVPQKLKETFYKNSIYFGLIVHFQEYNFCGTLPSDPPNFIKLL
jgi:hypothetical protein